MANIQSISNSFKVEVLSGIHHLDGTDTLKAALYEETGTQDSSTAIYSTIDEVTGTGYTPGGLTVTNATAPALDGITAHWTPSAALEWIGVTLGTSFDAVTLYNSTEANRAIATFTFSAQTVLAGNFTINMPANNGSTGLLRLT